MRWNSLKFTKRKRTTELIDENIAKMKNPLKISKKENIFLKYINLQLYSKQ